jgi:hypothetical protein
VRQRVRRRVQVHGGPVGNEAVKLEGGKREEGVRRGRKRCAIWAPARARPPTVARPAFPLLTPLDAPLSSLTVCLGRSPPRRAAGEERARAGAARGDAAACMARERRWQGGRREWEGGEGG